MKMKSKTSDQSFKICSAGTWIAVCRFQLYFLSSDGGQKVSRDHLRFMKLITDSKLIANAMEKNLN